MCAASRLCAWRRPRHLFFAYGISHDGCALELDIRYQDRRIAFAEYGDPAGKPVFLCHGEAFRKLSSAGVIEAGLSERLTRATGFRNVVAHAYEDLDMARVHKTAMQGPADLRAFLAAMATLGAAGNR